MRAFTYFVILAVMSSPAHIFANQASSELDNARATLSEAAIPKPLCRETVCPRLYMPVCGLVDGEQVTVPSRCVLNNKIRCASTLQRSLGEKVPSVRFLHSGPCSSKADKSSVVRMGRDMHIESDAEIVEEVPSEEEEDGNEADDGEEEGANEEEAGANEADDGEEEGANEEEHDASNDKTDEHAEIHNSGEINAIQHHNIDELEHLEEQADLNDKEAEADDAEAERGQAEELEEDEE